MNVDFFLHSAQLSHVDAFISPNTSEHFPVVSLLCSTRVAAIIHRDHLASQLRILTITSYNSFILSPGFLRGYLVPVAVSFLDFLFPQTHTRTQSQSLALIHEDPTVDIQMRDRELTEIAKSIASLAELFKDLSVLVIDQGTLLDSVEYNIEQTAVHVDEAVKDLNIATR